MARETNQDEEPIDAESREVAGSGKAIMALPSLVPASPDLIERAYVLWSTVAGRNASATRRLLIEEAEDGDMLPTEQAIRRWAKHHAWDVRADMQIRDTKDVTAYQLGVKWRAIMLGGADVLIKAQTGGYAGREMEGALAVKATEIGIRVIERGVLPLVVQPPIEENADTEGMSRDEIEARARQALKPSKERA
jgi:hypothetical protein